jgi:hypothetical protein
MLRGHEALKFVSNMNLFPGETYKGLRRRVSIDEVFDWRMGKKLAGNVSTKVIGVGKVVGAKRNASSWSMPTPTSAMRQP